MTDRCGVKGPGGVECNLPAGHTDEYHGFEFQVPPDLGRLIDAQLDRAEAAHQKYHRASRRLTWAFWALVAAIAAIALSAVNNILQALS